MATIIITSVDGEEKIPLLESELLRGRTFEVPGNCTEKPFGLGKCGATEK